MLLAKMGNKNFTLLSKMMDLHAARNRVHAQNVANINTPNYRRRELRFEKELRLAMEKGTSSDYAGIRGWIDRPNNTPVRNNGNNVDIDMEMMSMKENASFFEIYSQVYKKRADALQTAIKGVK